MTGVGYRIKVKISNNEIEVEGDKEFVVEKFNELKTEFLKGKKIISASTLTKSDSQRKMPSNLNLFLKQKNIKNKAEEILCVVFWLFHKENETLIHQTDIEECYKSARFKAPGNIPREIKACVSEGWILVSKEKKESKNAYTISAEGEEYIDSLEVEEK